MTSVITETSVTAPSSTDVVQTVSAIVLLSLVILLSGREIITGSVQDDSPALERVGKALDVCAIPFSAVFAIIIAAYIADILR